MECYKEIKKYQKLISSDQTHFCDSQSDNGDAPIKITFFFVKKKMWQVKTITHHYLKGQDPVLSYIILSVHRVYVKGTIQVLRAVIVK